MDKKYDSWESFVREHSDDFQRKFKKKIAPSGSILAMNLQFILGMLKKHCINFSSEGNIRNVLLFFYNKDKSTIPKVSEEFKLISIDYSGEIEGNFIYLG